MNEDVVYEKVRDAIASGRLHPNERLVEADLTAAYNVSRSAVRTALVRLEQEGLVEHERNRGAKVRLIDEDEAVEIYETRSALEALAARKAAERATADDVQRLRDLLLRIGQHLDDGELMAASDLNMSLHAAILDIAAHRTALRLVSTLNSHLVRYHYRTIMQPDRPRRSFEEHTAVVDAIAAHDADAAESAMHSHLRTVTATLREPLPPE
ncbi:GntR family transcriptional regulator [Microbacterium sp. STN6]|uniref:GntR family transcriptional regulator n=1 Tax=Microbacterium sp. STN6 TaxID=2995588 RepID=UPI002260F4A6|nr:GntR family transcriptional regulator [Microbacterium sp. STN6]MCX7523330.1 GntR family transcriptional regulator [Microbacterium sp. STN6]